MHWLPISRWLSYSGPGYVVPLWSLFRAGLSSELGKAWVSGGCRCQLGLISYLFRIYVNNFANYANVYGSLVGIILLLFWLYLSAVVIMAGSVLPQSGKNEAGEK